MEKAALFWSGGKDSAYALYKAQQERKYEIITLVTTLSIKYERISMHGVRAELLDKQAAATGIPLLKMWAPDIPTNEAYEKVLLETYAQLKGAGITTVIFGDIFLADLRKYREDLLSKAGLKADFPLWEQSTSVLPDMFLSAGFRTVTCCISTEHLTKEYLGRELDATFFKQLPASVDPCGENGEFHTFCFDGPVFKEPVSFTKGEERYVPLKINAEKETGFWYIDLL